MTVELDLSGPLFDGKVEGIIDNMTQEMVDEIGQVGVDLIQSELGHVLRHPTGFYRSNIMTMGDLIITDNGVVYGPWLEGVSSRNSRTRFPGYSTFRRMGQRLSNEWPNYVDHIVDDSVRELNR